MADITVRIIGDTRDLERKLSGLSGRLQTTSQRFRRFGRRATTFVTLPLAAAGGGAFKFASDLNEAVSLVDRTFGENAAGIQQWSQTTADSLGIARSDALQMVGTFGQMFQAMGFGSGEAADMSTSLVELASDMASAFNADPIEVLNNLRSGIVGEIEPLRKFGVQLSAAAVEQRALAQTGKSSADELTEQEKATARLGLIMEQTEGVQGDFAATADEAANRQRRMTAEAKDAAATIGSNLLPAGTKLLEIIGGLAQKFGNLSPGVQQAIVVVAAAAAAMGPLATAIGAVSGALAFLAANPVVLIIVGLVALGAAIVVAYQKFETFRNIVDGVLGFVRRIVEGFVSFVTDLWEEWGDEILAVASRVWELIRSQIDGALKIIRGIIKTVTSLIKGDWSGVWEGIKQIFSGVWTAIVGRVSFAIDSVRAIIKAGLDLVAGVFAGAWEIITGALSTFLDETVDFFEKLPGRIIDGLASVGQKIWDGTKAAWDFFKTKIAEAVTAYVNFYIALPGRIITALANVGQKIWDGTQAAWGFFTTQIGNLISRAVEFFRGLPGRAFHAVATAATTLAQLGLAIIAWVMGGINTAASAIWHFFERLPQDAFNILAGMVGDVIDIGRRIVEWIADGIRNGVGIIADAIRDLVRNAMPSFGFDPLGRSGSDVDFRKSFKGLHGGIVPGSMGEPRLIMAHGGERIVPTGQVGMSGGGLGGSTIIIELDGRVIANSVVDQSNRNGGLPIRIRTAS